MRKELLILAIQFITATFAFAENASPQRNMSFSIEEATISAIHTAIKNHQITCEQRAILRRLNARNIPFYCA